MAQASCGKLVVISGPSGAGKSTLLARLFQSAPVPLAASVSATTRGPRADEINGVHYHFLTDGEFASRRQRGEFLECFQVFGQGFWYGTLTGEVTSGLEAGKWVVLDIDVKGALAVVERYPDAITIFVRPPSLEVLEKRLRGRQSETESSITRRLEQARGEMALADRYRFQVINDDVDRAVREICDILLGQRQ